MKMNYEKNCDKNVFKYLYIVRNRYNCKSNITFRIIYYVF